MTPKKWSEIREKHLATEEAREAYAQAEEELRRELDEYASAATDDAGE